MALFLLIKFKNEETRKGTRSQTLAHGIHTHTGTNTHTHTQLMEFMRVVDTVIKGEGRGYSARGPWRGHASPSHKNTPLSLSLHQNCSQWVHSEVNL